MGSCKFLSNFADDVFNQPGLDGQDDNLCACSSLPVVECSMDTRYVGLQTVERLLCMCRYSHIGSTDNSACCESASNGSTHVACANDNYFHCYLPKSLMLI